MGVNVNAALGSVAVCGVLLLAGVRRLEQHDRRLGLESTKADRRPR